MHFRPIVPRRLPVRIANARGTAEAAAAGGDALEGANKASARYAAGTSESDRRPPPLRLLTDIGRTCSGGLEK